MALYSIPPNFGSGGSGLNDGTLKKVVDQLRGVTQRTYTAGGTITTATKATVNLSDGSKW
jgi:hypothetical protein